MLLRQFSGECICEESLEISRYSQSNVLRGGSLAKQFSPTRRIRNLRRGIEKSEGWALLFQRFFYPVSPLTRQVGGNLVVYFFGRKSSLSRKFSTSNTLL